MKRITLSFLMLGLSAAIIFSCKKPDNKAPEADTETGTAVDAVWATYAITDIEQITAFIGENQLLTNFYKDVPGSFNSTNSTGSMTATRDTNGLSKNINFAFNKTTCYDGRFREGTVFWFYSYDKDYDPFALGGKGNPNARYTHDNGLVARIRFSDYKVDGWDISNDPDKLASAFVVNLMPENYSVTATPIKWRIRGEFIMKSPDLVDRSKDMKISVDLVKTLVNSSDKKIYDQSVKGAYINWSNFSPGSPSAPNPSIATTGAMVAYTGTVAGNTTNGQMFRMIIDEKNPLIRDFTCYADKIGGVAVGSGTVGLVPRYQEFHPFIAGVASFTTGLDATHLETQFVGKSSIYPRQIYFGNEDNADYSRGYCDNSALVLIKGIGYKVDLKK